VGWRRLGTRGAAAVTAVVAIALVAVVINALGHEPHGGGVATFNACIKRTRFLVLVRHGNSTSATETIDDRARGGEVGEVAIGRRAPMVGVSASGNGRYVMSTATPVGRDASSIDGCWNSAFPGP
jgi:hypothetical protein